jgi:hypothetical protein
VPVTVDDAVPVTVGVSDGNGDSVALVDGDAVTDGLEVAGDVWVGAALRVSDGDTDADGLNELDGEFDVDCDDDDEPEGVTDADGLLLAVWDGDAVCVGVRVGVVVAVWLLDGVREGV